MVKRLIIVLLLLGLVFGGIFGWKHHQAQQQAAQASAPPPPATIAATEVRTESWQPYLFAVGSLVATQGIHVTNEVAGQVEKIHFQSGQVVTEGEPLLQLDDSVDRAELAGLVAQRRLAEIRFKRITELLQKNVVPKADYDEAQANLDNASAQVASQRRRIEEKQIQAPFAGLLGIREVDIGEYLAAGARIVPLQALDPIYVDYSLPEQNFARLSAGQSVRLTVKAYPKRTFQGRIEAINPGIDPGTRSVRIRAVLDNPGHHLRPGMFAEVRTLLPERANVLTLPRTAITYAPYGDSVFVIEEADGDLVVQRRQVQTGEVREGRVEIVQGLEAGERVVAAGQVKLRNGQRVRIDNSVELDQRAGPVGES
ncbi:MAG: efflux RND transporter periplasmic adaptor subunit [Gammaproteobacteria bacterium]|nr:efflux RND transporter periplasmic adaptor subunit [Gammaproteobacteria bacterium]NIR85390.1 efflux RND transporter periplasmic adaptor subunit [Gammaproteobacteria bacterium]NIR88908.1 efflux RND transporter periplasmic adaptor subunit [Gammaproteobacteria bacterium]NIU06516.1 efflux RND transporter periplasmic adaptor subunit [Gammaproteobacteria bacterium]NIV53409.1 efflux RND transporter periplasmic adaptor subunit [Gammaproteobacteria bacterium]